VSDRAVLPPAHADSTPAGEDPDDLTSLRSILLAPAEAQIQRLQARLDDRYSQARDVSAVLPQALVHCSADPELARALAPPVEKAITASVRRDPKPLADAIFPIIGPAIRKAVAASLAAMLESMNRTLEHSVSWRAIRWRLEARRTGRTFAEVVLLHTLLYRVEQVFLIHRKTGLLLHHVRASPAGVADAQMVSAMLTAIRDFAQDSFRTADHDSLDSFDVGELSVWIEQGPEAVIAAVIRGNAPKDFRQTLQHAVERVQLQFGEPLAAFDGDAQAFAAARPILEECLHSEFRADESSSRSRLLPILATVVLLAIGAWALLAWRQYDRWSRYLAALRQEPGIVVISTGRAGGKYAVSGLRDPLARDPAQMLAQANLTTADVVGNWEPYQALAKPFVLSRAARVLAPPDGVTLDLRSDVLSATGLASPAWIADAIRLAPLIPGVSRFDSTALVEAELQALARRIEGTILFARGTTQIVGNGATQLPALASAVHALDTLLASVNRSARIEVVGHTDGDGDPASNLPLSRARAERVVQALEIESLSHVEISPVGVGSEDPLRAGESETDKQQNRRVTVRVSAAPSRPTRSAGR
jgi:outer membrane protein OmpA-like peptidoglycan-associated protein